jgi:shikimate kinase
MAAGKTTLGKALARSAGLSFVDLDWYIEQRMHRSVSQLFAERGEEGFRVLERNLLHEVAQFEDVVISTGGGAPCFFDNMAFMNSCGRTVFLDVDPEVLFARLRVARYQRPLIREKDDDQLRAFIASALAEREPRYAQAGLRFVADRLDSRSQIDASVEQLRQLLQL